MTHPTIAVEGLRVAFRGREVVHGVSLRIAPGECLALVGESGSGKSVTARSLLGLAGSGSLVTADRLELQGERLPEPRSRHWRSLRGGRIGLVLQDALVSLDPLRPVGREIADTLRLHTDLDRAARRRRVLELLHDVGMPDPEVRAAQRSGELSGGLRQRALIASAIAADPDLLIADEPTTALDATVQSQVLTLLAGLRDEGTSMLLISHDLAVVQRVADRVAVMRDGVVVEEGPTERVLSEPRHDYTRMLLRSVPSTAARGVRLTERHGPHPAGISPNLARTTEAARTVATASAVEPRDVPLVRAVGLRKEFARPDAHPLLAVDGVDLTVRAGTTLGLVGESGSGKTTLAKIILGLTEPDAGHVDLDGDRFSSIPERQRRRRRGTLGAVYQDPLSSFDPRHTVRDILDHAVPRDEPRRRDRIAELLDSVALPRTLLDRRPLHLSGGQRQRVAIARALAPRPRLLVCDEPVSALDVSVQAHVLDLFDDLQKEFGLAYLFISHDLGVVQHMSDEVAVMLRGGIVETGDAASVFAAPRHDYTRRLFDATPTLERR